MTRVADFAGSVSGFFSKSSVEQLLLLAWFLEARLARSGFDGSFMRQCFRDVGLEPPDMSVYLPRLASKKPPQLVKTASGYRLHGNERRRIDKMLGQNATAVAVSKLLADLPGKVPDLSERDFLQEALKCYQVGAYRAAIVMSWNLAFDHVVEWVLADEARIESFNDAIKRKEQKKSFEVKKREDFYELKESEFIELSRSARLLDKNISQIMREKLNRRNIAAHPSLVTITQHQADDFITDLVNNVVLALKK